MTPHATYRQRRSTTAGWTRIDLLLALYNAAIDALEKAQLAQHEQHSTIETEQRMRANQLVLGILAGVDPEACEPDSVAGNVQRLAVFVLDRIAQRDLEPAVATLKKLRDAYEGIREEARQLEQRGVIPPIETGGSGLCQA